jgi:hypothetical protein
VEIMANEKHDELDRVLEASLAKYAAVEPRRGLEERVLATLRGERARVPDRARWRWGVMAGLAAMVIVAATLAWRSGKPSHSVGLHPASAAAQAPKEKAQVGSNRDGNGVRPQDGGAMPRSVVGRSRPRTVIASHPKLDQFPSPQPLSEQEKILANFVARDPEHAALIAQARTEALRKDRVEEIRDAASGNEQDSQHQDR